jgi:hypothetical protein
MATVRVDSLTDLEAILSQINKLLSDLTVFSVHLFKPWWPPSKPE